MEYTCDTFVPYTLNSEGAGALGTTPVSSFFKQLQGLAMPFTPHEVMTEEQNADHDFDGVTASPVLGVFVGMKSKQVICRHGVFRSLVQNSSLSDELQTQRSCPACMKSAPTT